jgi:isoleucyl-tRNA synthetase
MAEVRRVVELGRAARAEAGIRLRQPLSEFCVADASLLVGYEKLIADELRVKHVRAGQLPENRVRLKPNLPVLGPRLGPALPEVREALAAGSFEIADDGTIQVGEHRLASDEVMGWERVSPDPAWVFAEDDAGVVVALNTSVDEKLELEGRVYDLIHAIQRLRKEAGLDISDRIVLTLPEDDGVDAYADWIKAETLAVEIETGPELAVRKLDA